MLAIRTRARRRLPAALLLGLALVAAASAPAPYAEAAESCSPDGALALVRSTTDELFAAVDAYQGVISEHPADARAMVDKYITPHVDLRGVSKLVLGKHWRSASDAQRERFIAQFHILMLRTYATAVTSYNGIQIEYLPMREEPRENLATVRTLIPRAGGEGVTVDYRLHCGGGDWKLFDVIIAGVSMVTTYRSAFASEVNRSGLDGLIDSLEKKNAEIGA